MANPCFALIVKCPENVLEFGDESFFFCFFVLDPISILAFAFTVVIYTKAPALS